MKLNNTIRVTFCLLMSFSFFTKRLSAQDITAISNVQTFNLPLGSNTNDLLLWSDSGTWQGGVLPTVGNKVIIPSNSAVLLDTLVDVQSIEVQGILVIDPSKDADISAEWIRLMGTSSYFEWGSPSEPYSHNGLLTLKGDDTNAMIPGTGNVNYKAFMVVGGRLELHGSNAKTSWTNLEETALAGDSQIQLAEVTNWEVGDEIVITTTERYLNETEERTITAVLPDGKTFVLDTPLNYQHFGEIQTYDNGKSGQDFETWKLDERAEVALLTRAIKIQGDANSESLGGFGGHMMYMNNPTIHISDIEFFQMGQKGKLARYPIHWHLAEDQTGDYVKNSSIHHTFNRAITLHGTDNTRIENNVVHESYGHAIFLEDAVEMGHTFHKNLVINTRRPDAQDALVPSDDGTDGIRIEGPAAFWIANPANTFTENVAAGSEGAGFWYGLPEGPTGPGGNLPGKENLKPRELPMGTFDKNKAHSCHSGLHFDHSHNMAMTEIENAHYKPLNENGQVYMPEVTNYTGYKCFRAWWTRTIGPGINFKRTIVADCIGESNTVSSFEGKTENSLFVGHSDNSPKGTFFKSFAVSLYDGQIQVIDCHFENYDRPQMSSYVWFDGAVNRTNDFQSGCTYKNAYYFNFNVRSIATQLGSIIHDADGSMLDHQGSIVMEHPFLMDEAENFTLVQPPTRGFKSTNHFGAIWLIDKEGNEHAWNTSWANGHVLHSDENYQLKHQIPVTTATGRVYTFRPVEKYSNSISFTYQYGRNGDKFDAKFIDSSLELSVSGATQVSSEAQVYSAQSSAWAWENGTLYLRLVAGGDSNGSDFNNQASRAVTITHTSPNSSDVISRNSVAYDINEHKENRRISAVKYDYGGDGVAYNEIGIYPTRGSRFSDETYTGDLLRLGEVAQMKANLTGSDGELVNAIHNTKVGEWWNYTLDITQAGDYPFYMLLASSLSWNQVKVKVDGVEAFVSSLGSTGGANKFKEVLLNTLNLSAGTHIITVEAGTDNFKFGWLSVGAPTDINQPPSVGILNSNDLQQIAIGDAVVVNANATDLDGQIAFVNLYLNGQLIERKTTEPFTFNGNSLDVLDEGDYSIMVEAIDNDGANSIEAISLTVGNGSQGVYWDFEFDDQGWNSNPHNCSVTWNNGKLDCSPTGNDPYVYNVVSPTFVSANINYLVVRVKNGTAATAGHIYVFTVNSGAIPITVPMTPNSAGYETVEVDLSTISGWNNNLSVTNVRIDPNGGGESGIVSYDYIGFSDASGSLDLPDSELDDDLDGVTNDVDLCPDSVYPSFVNSSGCFDLPGNNFLIKAIGETCVDKKNGLITISATNTLSYSVRLNDSENYEFSSELTLENLTPGTYSICITVSEEPDYEQCFNLTVDAAEEISGKTVRTKYGDIITETTSISSGTAPYTISVNGEALFSTYDRNFSVDVNHGDQISVSSKFECEGILFSDINLTDQFIASPNPTTDYVDILVPTIKKQEISVTVYSLLQQKVSENNYEIQNGRIRVPLNHLPVGLYFVTLNLKTPVNFKIMKHE